MNAQNSAWALDFPRMSSQTSEPFEHSKVFGVFQQPANVENSDTSAEAGLTINSPKAGDVDFSFLWGGAINGSVESVVVQPDGKILIGGEFTTVHGAARGHIARLNADGSTDYTFMNGLSGADDWGTVYSIAVQGDGKIL